MSDETTTGRIAGASVEELTSEAAESWLSWLTGHGPVPSESHSVQFALAHSDAGVTWGYLDGQGIWKLGHAIDPGLCPLPTSRSLQELRLFGTAAEVLIWRGDEGLSGRILADNPANVDTWLAPMNEGRRLRGEPQPPQDGFKRYVDVGGAQHIAPAQFPEEFSVRHYLEQDSETGAVRIAATRLVPEKLS